MPLDAAVIEAAALNPVKSIVATSLHKMVLDDGFYPITVQETFDGEYMIDDGPNNIALTKDMARALVSTLSIMLDGD